MALSNKIENKNQIEFEPWKEAITKLGIKAAEMVKDKLDFPKEVKEWIKEFFDQMRGKIVFEKWILKIKGQVPDNLKWFLDTLSDKEQIKKLQGYLRQDYNPLHESTLDWIPWPFTLWALLNNLLKEKYNWKLTMPNKESIDTTSPYESYIWTLPKEVMNKLRSQTNKIWEMIKSFESWSLNAELVREAQVFLDEGWYYLGHKSSRDGVPWQHTQNAILNYALSLT